MTAQSGLDQFLADIKPFFYQRDMTYVDVGAYHGDVFVKVLESGLRVGEAHLIEPNEKSLQVARDKTANAFRGRSVDFHPLAVGGQVGRVRMHEAKSMTKVVERIGEHPASSQTIGDGFEVACTTLDELASKFTERHISLLKIDVEGYEMDVLAGSRSLLRDQQIDVIYVEAGMNPQGTQQCYYRHIEDALREYGYRIFKIYEQRHEWREDSPILRRVNVAFFSDRFAQSNPYRVTRKLFQAKRELEASARRTALLEQQLQDAQASLAGLQQDLERGAAEKEQLASELNTLKSAEAANARALESAMRANRALGQTLRELFDSIAELHRRELRAWREALEARAETARIRGGFAHRLGSTLINHARSPAKWLATPAALWREYFAYRRDHRAKVPGSTAEAVPEIEFADGKTRIWMPLTLKTQAVSVPALYGESEVWGTAIAARIATTVTMRLTILDDEGVSRGRVECHARLSDQRVRFQRQFQMKPGVPVRLVESAGKGLVLGLSRMHGDFCVLRIELRPQGARKAKTIAGDVGEISQSGESRTAPHARKEFTAADLDKKLWGGFARYALPALEQLKRNSLASPSEQENAAWYLARWWFVEEDHDRALENIGFAKSLNGRPQARFMLAEAQCLIKIGRYEEADSILERGTRILKKPDFQLLRSTLIRHRDHAHGRPMPEVESAQLAALNEIYAASGLLPIQKKRPQDPLSLANITSATRPRSRASNLKVSVIIPAHNAAQSIEWVVDSILHQTWSNLEIIVVDDCSTDDTSGVVQEIARRDSRVRLVKRERNSGAYAARNAGLRHATGDLITAHDSDDWSHPQRIELQVEALEANPSIVGVKSHWVRVTENLEIVGSWIPKGTLFDLNFSSLLFRKELLDVLGNWEEVLVSGDAEFYSRLKTVFGAEAVLKLPRQQLLALSLTRENSLTRSKATHLRGIYYGLRCNYRAAYLHWHSRITAGSDELPLHASQGKRRFPVPLGNRPNREPDQKYDLVVISDLALRGGAFVSTLNYIIAACRAGMKVGVFHWRKYALSADSPLQSRLYDACLEYDIDILSPGDSVATRIVLVGYPAILQHKIEPMPSITTEHLIVIVNQYATRLIDGQDEQYDPLQARANLESIFGMQGIWVPISAWVKRLMDEDSRYPAPYPTPWFPMIDAASWCQVPIRWRGRDREVPAVGRHGRDSYTKWPSDPLALSQAYGVGQPWDVRFLGGADHAVEQLGGMPGNWSVVPFDGMTAQEFLQDLDFYVHYPHEKYIEEFGRAVMEAMAVGLPVILPPQFRETFGDAAIYAPPGEVPAVISTLWASQDEYLKRAQAGRNFVLANCDITAFAGRLQGLLQFSAAVPDRTTSERVDSDASTVANDATA